jgi:glutaredoxin
MDITIFKTSGCGYCVKIIELMERAQVDYTAVMVGQDITREEFVSKYPEVQGFPHVIIDGHSVGGLVETVKLFVEKGLVSSKKK